MPEASIFQILSAPMCTNDRTVFGETPVRPHVPSQLRHDIPHFDSVLNLAHGHPYMRVAAGCKVLELCGDIKDWDRAYRASSKAISLAPLVVLRSHEQSDKTAYVRQNC